MQLPPIEEEQQHFDKVLDVRERARAAAFDVLGATANAKTARSAREQAEENSARLGPPDSEVAFGRIDTEDGETYYIGLCGIWDERQDTLVVDWRTPVGSLYSDASVEDDMGLISKREFVNAQSATGNYRFNEIQSLSDTIFAELARDIERLNAPSDALLAELERNRSEEMTAVAATIQAAQNKVLREPLESLLLVQGGPGTGKSAVALHRVSWLLYNYRAQLQPADVLIVGPSNGFSRYIRGVLPSLGDSDVTIRSLQELCRVPVASSADEEDPALARLKGESRMSELLERALWQRISAPSEPLKFPAGRRTATIERDRVEELLESATKLSWAEGRNHLRRSLESEIATSGGLGAGESPTEMIEASRTAVNRALDRIWPSLSASAFLRDTLGSSTRLLDAAGELFTADEVNLLQRQSARQLTAETWTRQDLPLLDECDYLVSAERFDQHKHVVIDEAQDLSEMALRSIRRRSLNGSITILGDLAQSTGAWARDSWEGVLDTLAGDFEPTVRELEMGYRVPTQIYEFAAELLKRAAPEIKAPRAVRAGTFEPTLIETADDTACIQSAVDLVQERTSLGDFVGLIAPPGRTDDLVGELNNRGIAHRTADAAARASVVVLSPSESKGLEFDASIVAFPEEIGSLSGQGLRLLYIAYTRATRFLGVAHQGDPLFKDQASRPHAAAPVGSGRRKKKWWERSSRAGAAHAHHEASVEGSADEPEPATISSRDRARAAGTKWTPEELEVAVDNYIRVLLYERDGTPLNKSELVDNLSNGELAPRTSGSVSYRMMNISAVIHEHGFAFVEGWKPAENVGTNVRTTIWEVAEPRLADAGLAPVEPQLPSPADEPAGAAVCGAVQVLDSSPVERTKEPPVDAAEDGEHTTAELMEELRATLSQSEADMPAQINALGALIQELASSLDGSTPAGRKSLE